MEICIRRLIIFESLTLLLTIEEVLLQDAIDINGNGFFCRYLTRLLSCSRKQDKNATLPDVLIPAQIPAARRTSITNIQILYSTVYPAPQFPSSWTISSMDCFKSCEEARAIEIIGELRISQHLQDTPAKRKNTLENMFKLPKLEDFQCTNCSLDSANHMWVFPENLQLLGLRWNMYTKFDLSTCGKLKKADFSYNRLVQMPTFSFPPPPLEELNLIGNPALIVMADDIALLCKLRVLHISTKDGIMGTPKAICHCIKLKQWAVEYKMILTGGNCAAEDECKNYSLNEARRKREMCVSGVYPTTSPIASTLKPKSSPGTLKWWELLIALSFVLLLIIVTTVILWRTASAGRVNEENWHWESANIT